MRRAQWRAIGIKPEDFEKPKIAVVNSSSKLSVCFIHLDELSNYVQQGIRDAGGLPFEIRTTAPSDIVTGAGKEGRYLMPSRDLIVNDIEVQVEGALLDGMVCLSSCDKTTPAHLMAAARLNIPTVIVACGYQLGCTLDSKIYDIEDVYELVGAYRAGTLDIDTFQKITDVAICGPGVCAGMGTANSMQIIAEALGMCLPGSTPIYGGSEKLKQIAYQAGKLIVHAVLNNLKPRDIITPKSIENAITVAQSVGASVNCVRHLAALSVEAELDIDVVQTYAKKYYEVPTLALVRPNGFTRIEDFEKAGGTLALMKKLEPLLHLDVINITGSKLSEVLKQAPAPDNQIIRPLENPYHKHGSLLVLKGNLAPQGALVKVSAVPPHLWKFEGPARVFDDEEKAFEHIMDIRKGDVVVLRGLGPKGGPGTVFAASFVAAANGAGIAQHIAVVTDGELSGLNRGLVVGQVMPEAAEGGPLAIVEDGDLISIDLNNATITLKVDENIIKERMARWRPKQPPLRRSWLTIYYKNVQPIYRGAPLG